MFNRRKKDEWKARAALVHNRYVANAQVKSALITNDEIIRFLALAIAGEAGELANIMKKGWRGDDDYSLRNPAAKKKIADEMADIRIYLEHLAMHLDIDLDAACLDKIGVVEKRLKVS